MKKLLLILSLFSMTAHAEWKIDGFADNYVSYIDYSRIKTEGKYKSMWYLNDFKSSMTTSSGKPYKSSVGKYIIDCRDSKQQRVAVYLYSEQMGKGEVVLTENNQIIESEWKYPPPNSIGDKYMNTACGRK